MDKRNTCDRCVHYTPSTYPEDDDFQYAGACALMGDSGDAPNAIDRCSGWDYESYKAGVYVGPKFGCIHFTPNPKKDTP